MVCLINFIGLSESRRFEDSSGRVCRESFTDKIRAKTPIMGEFTYQDLSRLMGDGGIVEDGAGCMLWINKSLTLKVYLGPSPFLLFFFASCTLKNDLNADTSFCTLNGMACSIIFIDTG